MWDAPPDKTILFLLARGAARLPILEKRETSFRKI